MNRDVGTPVGVSTLNEAGGFEAFYRANYAPVLKLAYVLTGRWAIAEEITQEAFMRLLYRRGKTDDLRRPDAWVRTVAANLARSQMRRLGAEVRALGRLMARRDTAGEALAPMAAEAREFWEAVRRLPPRQAQAVALYYLEDRPVGDVAAVMGCAEGTAKALLHQGRQRLGKQFGSQPEVER